MRESRRAEYASALEDLAANCRDHEGFEPVEELRQLLDRMGDLTYTTHEVQIQVPDIEGWSTERVLEEVADFIGTSCLNWRLD